MTAFDRCKSESTALIPSVRSSDSSSVLQASMFTTKVTSDRLDDSRSWRIIDQYMRSQALSRDGSLKNARIFVSMRFKLNDIFALNFA